MFSDQSGITLEINNKKIILSGKFSNVSKLHSIPLNESWVKEKVIRETRKYFELNNNINTIH